MNEAEANKKGQNSPFTDLHKIMPDPQHLVLIHDLPLPLKSIFLFRFVAGKLTQLNVKTMKKLLFFLSLLWLAFACQNPAAQDNSARYITSNNIEKVISSLTQKYGEEHRFRIERGVSRAAELWRPSDGTNEEFENFCNDNFIASQEELNLVFDRLANNYEFIQGYLGRIGVELNRQIHEDRGAIHKIDQIFGAFSPGAHLQEDLFTNKIAFIIVLNFPRYSLEEKNQLGGDWDGRQWGFARLGDYFSARIPPRIIQDNNSVYSKGRLYISEYNIFAGRLLDNNGNTLFPENMRLLSHWNIRDEIKSNYDIQDGLPKQEMLYTVMLRIINQDIPMEVINNAEHQWNPFTNTLYTNGQQQNFQPEDTRRYQVLLDNFKANRQIDPYYPALDTYIKRRFESSMEIPYEEVSSLFREYASSPLIRETAKIISQRLGRELRPFDLWYNGFVGRAGISEAELDRITKTRYPNAQAFNNDLPRQLRQLGFDRQMADFLAERIDVDAARGSGHALRASMRSMPSHLRTRIAADGMDYKGYNIAVHEFGHNVEQTISIHFVDNYFIGGIPNTAFTEAIAFMFQKRDLELLGIHQKDPLMEHLDALDVFWDNYEMMGVSLVDMEVWQWMYDHPEANAQQLKEAVVRIAKEIWNEYYADVFGERDVPLLAIYSHMIQSPLYLMNYPYGRLIMFQLEDYLQGKDFAQEVQRIYSIGSITPRHWMERAVGQQISNQPIFAAVERALEVVR
jgi:hypothetical protein